MRLTLWIDRSWERSTLIGQKLKSRDKPQEQSYFVANGVWRPWDR